MTRYGRSGAICRLVPVAIGLRGWRVCLSGARQKGRAHRNPALTPSIQEHCRAHPVIGHLAPIIWPQDRPMRLSRRPGEWWWVARKAYEPKFGHQERHELSVRESKPGGLSQPDLATRLFAPSSRLISTRMFQSMGTRVLGVTGASTTRSRHYPRIGL